MQKYSKKGISLVLVFCMLITMMTSVVFLKAETAGLECPIRSEGTVNIADSITGHFDQYGGDGYSGYMEYSNGVAAYKKNGNADVFTGYAINISQDYIVSYDLTVPTGFTASNGIRLILSSSANGNIANSPRFDVYPDTGKIYARYNDTCLAIADYTAKFATAQKITFQVANDGKIYMWIDGQSVQFPEYSDGFTGATYPYVDYSSKGYTLTGDKFGAYISGAVFANANDTVTISNIEAWKIEKETEEEKTAPTMPEGAYNIASSIDGHFDLHGGYNYSGYVEYVDGVATYKATGNPDVFTGYNIYTKTDYVVSYDLTVPSGFNADNGIRLILASTADASIASSPRFDVYPDTGKIYARYNDNCVAIGSGNTKFGTPQNFTFLISADGKIQLWIDGVIVKFGKYSGGTTGTPIEYIDYAEAGYTFSGDRFGAYLCDAHFANAGDVVTISNIKAWYKDNSFGQTPTKPLGNRDLAENITYLENVYENSSTYNIVNKTQAMTANGNPAMWKTVSLDGSCPFMVTFNLKFNGTNDSCIRFMNGINYSYHIGFYFYKNKVSVYKLEYDESQGVTYETVGLTGGGYSEIAPNTEVPVAMLFNGDNYTIWVNNIFVTSGTAPWLYGDMLGAYSTDNANATTEISDISIFYTVDDSNIIGEIAYGDINSDGTVDILDLVRFKKYSANMPVESFLTWNADCNMDGKLELAADMVALRKILFSGNIYAALGESAAVSTYSADSFTLGAYHNTYSMADNAFGDAAQNLKDSNLDLLIGVGNTERSWNNAWYDACEAAGMDFLASPNSLYQSPNLNLTKLQNEVNNLTSKYSHFKGFYLYDEPRADKFEIISKVNQEIFKLVPSALNLNCLLPSYGRYTWDANTTDGILYNQYIDSYLDTVNPSVLATDYYPFNNLDGIIEADMASNNLWKDMGYLSYAANAAGKDYWHVFSALDDWNTGTSAKMSTARIKLQLNAALAYGAKGALYFCGNQSIVDHLGQKTDRYDELSALNLAAKNIGNVLFDAERKGIYHSIGFDTPAEAYLDDISDSAVISSIEKASSSAAPNVVVSEFAKGTEKYIVVLNKEYSKATKGTIRLKSAASVSTFDAGNNAFGASSSASSISFELAAGEIAVYKLG